MSGLCLCQQIEEIGLLDNILTATHTWLNKHPNKRNKLQRMPYASSFRCVEDMLACIADNTLLDSCMAYYDGDSEEQLINWMSHEHIQCLDRTTLTIAMNLTKL